MALRDAAMPLTAEAAEDPAGRSRGLPVVAVVGRPNVGKSTFFNRLVGGRRALAFNRPGVTRDRHYGQASYLGRRFVVIDTGGFEPDAEAHDVYRQVRNQALLAIDEADIVLIFFDARQGVLPGDQELVDMLRGCGRPVLFVVNKVDTPQLEAEAYDFYRLGIDNLLLLSVEGGRGGDDLLDELLNLLPDEPPPSREQGVAQQEDDRSPGGGGAGTLGTDNIVAPRSHDLLDRGSALEDELEDEHEDALEGVASALEVAGGHANFRSPLDAEGGLGSLELEGDLPDHEELEPWTKPGRAQEREESPWAADERRFAPSRRRRAPEVPRIALIGRPNVGKSSLANQILGQQRQVIHPEAGTTRDSIDIPFQIGDRSYVLVDTAGVRRKARITDKLEQYTVVKAFKAIEQCDLALLLIDAEEGVTAQEKRLAGMIEEKGKGVAVIVNKWDLMKGRGQERQPYADTLLRQLEHIRYAPVHFISALTGMGVPGILPLIENVSSELDREIPTVEFNRVLREAVEAHHPPLHRGQLSRIYYGLQVKTRPPTFLLFVSQPQGIRPDYRRYLENQLRQRFGFVGAPVHLVVRARKQ